MSIERISTMQTASVITQTTHPLRVLKAIIQTESVITQSVDATERPMTLIEKLEEKKSEVWQMMLADDAPFPYYYMTGQFNTISEIIDIVKQHTQPSSEVQDD